MGTTLSTALPLLLFSLKSLLKPSNLNHGTPGESLTFDYIVVGGGTAGLAVAARLAEDARVSVAVAEAGGNYEVEGGILSIIPGLAPAAGTWTDVKDYSPVDWNFRSEGLKGANDRVLRYARGKALGGTSARNFMLYHRGTKGTFDRWAEEVGDESWNWDSVLPLFKRVVNHTPPDMDKRAPNTTVSYNPDAFDNSLNGPVKVSWPNYGYPFGTHLEKGLEAIGIRKGADFNTGELAGSSWPSMTVDPEKCTRSSSKTSYLDGAAKTAPKLKIYAHTMAKKIIFSANTAIGVEVETKGKKYALYAHEEVILSAGAFQSPQLLMVSGIGPKDTLEPLGIPVIKHLPGVGKNMWDHILFGVVNRVNVVTATRMANSLLAKTKALAQYTVKRGPLTASGYSVIGWEKLPESARENLSPETISALDTFPSDWPDVEYIGLDGIFDGWKTAADQIVKDKRNNYATVAASLMTPMSRGSISIRSTDTNDPPVIDLGYLTHPADREVVVEVVKRLREIWDAMPDVRVNGEEGEEYLPGKKVQSDEEILAFVQRTVAPVWHPAGTCRMGKTNTKTNAEAETEGEDTDDTDAAEAGVVVDSKARVLGVKGLRVVDASVFPVLPPGHPQSAVYMVAEKIVADIKGGWKEERRRY